jgi:glycosyltransferase involved in cell wall biosynthesis
MAQPLVSVVVPAFTHERYVEAALQSVYEQTYEPIELIVVDDQSLDRTAAVIEEFCNRAAVADRFRRTVLIKNETNVGAHASINRGLHESRGDYINILNSDDLFSPNRVVRLLDACERNGADFAFSRVELLVEDPAEASDEAPFLYRVQDSIHLFPTVGYALLRNQCALSTGNFFFSRRVHERIGDFCALKYCHDWDFILRAVLITEPVFVAEPLYVYRLHASNSFRQLQALAEQETARVLGNYFLLCRTRPVANPLAPSPAWGPFFDSFVEASGVRGPLRHSLQK